ncbi:putative helicase CHR10 [Vitis vinifera]|uniref:Putative helicase CHR10 n=1 Tax=Vitis vinifera TaxID=29760 RepID=A0A438BW42_VITVI|nr:putative helicase CHR10 [Vitis vinifera]
MKSKLIECGTLVLPPLTEITVMAPLVPCKKKVYMSILRKNFLKLLAFSSGPSGTKSLQNIVLQAYGLLKKHISLAEFSSITTLILQVIQLRKACSHPYLFPGIEPEPYEEGEHLVQASGKLIILDQLLQKLYNSGHRVLLFAQMTHTLDILQVCYLVLRFMELRKYSYERLDGSVRAEERFSAIRSFSRKIVEGSLNSQDVQSSAFVFMISTRAGGVGLNLVAADTVIFYEQDWNPQVDKQALQRAHRIGQMNHVLSINLVTGRTVEEVRSNKPTKKEMSGAEAGDLRSVIFGLRMIDPSEINNDESSEPNMSELDAMSDKVVAIRHEQQLGKDDGKFEVNPMDLLKGHDLIMDRSSVSVDFDPGLDEASYLLQGRRQKEKLAKWEAHGYNSLSVKDPPSHVDVDMISDSGSVDFVYGDCTLPSKVCPSEATIIFRQVSSMDMLLVRESDCLLIKIAIVGCTIPAILSQLTAKLCASLKKVNGNRTVKEETTLKFPCTQASSQFKEGMFDALARLSSSVPDAYQRASEFKDLHLGDLHFIKINEDCEEQRMDCNAPQWVALAVVQSYNPRRKVPRSNISVPDLECCLSKASFLAAQKSASIHMPRIGYQDRSEWYTMERLLRKYASLYGIKIFVYPSFPCSHSHDPHTQAHTLQSMNTPN